MPWRRIEDTEKATEQQGMMPWRRIEDTEKATELQLVTQQGAKGTPVGSELGQQGTSVQDTLDKVSAP